MSILYVGLRQENADEETEALPSITFVSQLCMRTLKKRIGRRKLDNKNGWRKKKKTITRVRKG